MREIIKRYLRNEIPGSMLNLAIEVDETLYDQYFDREHPGYCTQNDGKCSTCSLVNYGLDCHNNLINPKLPEIIDNPDCAD